MNKESCILITGVAGFIASVLAKSLNNKGYNNLVLVDDFTKPDKDSNHNIIRCKQKIERELLFDIVKKNPFHIDFVFHLGARTDTTEMDYEVHKKLNVEYSKMIWSLCTEKQIPLVYASSAATYGDGVLGYDDNHALCTLLKPLNPYGVSKNEFDIWALAQENKPPFWSGLKFFNVYGPNEYHKGRMASVIYHAYHQIKENNSLRLFKSHHPNYTDGGQLRDFIYVKDIVKICEWLMQAQPQSGIYNAGTGNARTFLDLANAVFLNLGKVANIQFIDTPLDIRDKYQYFTEANMQKLITAGYQHSFYSLENGIEDYVNNYLLKQAYY